MSSGTSPSTKLANGMSSPSISTLRAEFFCVSAHRRWHLSKLRRTLRKRTRYDRSQVYRQPEARPQTQQRDDRGDTRFRHLAHYFGGNRRSEYDRRRGRSLGDHDWHHRHVCNAKRRRIHHVDLASRDQHGLRSACRLHALQRFGRRLHCRPFEHQIRTKHRSKSLVAACGARFLLHRQWLGAPARHSVIRASDCSGQRVVLEKCEFDGLADRPLRGRSQSVWFRVRSTLTALSVTGRARRALYGCCWVVSGHPQEIVLTLPSGHSDRLSS